jgi:hypothetical protein
MIHHDLLYLVNNVLLNELEEYNKAFYAFIHHVLFTGIAEQFDDISFGVIFYSMRGTAAVWIEPLLWIS